MRQHKHKDSPYTKRLKEHIGPVQEGRTDYFNLTHKQSIEMIKEGLKTNFSCNLWTVEWPEFQLKMVDNELTKEGIVHCYDEVFDAFICFRNESDMKGFYDKLRKDASEDDLQYMREHNVNTPVIKWYE
jgi:hypothetical protein